MSLEVLQKFNIKAKKSLGQNFLVDENILQGIARSIEVSGKNIVEVGPGYGALTKQLLEQKPSCLDLVELDRDMIKILETRVQEKDMDIGDVHFNIHNTDVLQFESEQQNYSVVANIPYYITSPILRHFLYGVVNKPEQMVILMQKDVGDKILGKGKNKSSVLSLFIEKKCHVSEMMQVPKESFIPAPKVQSSVLLFEFQEETQQIPDDIFLEGIKNGFREPRKKLINNLMKSGYEKQMVLSVFENLGIPEAVRGEDLDIGVWIDLLLLLKKEN